MLLFDKWKQSNFRILEWATFIFQIYNSRQKSPGHSQKIAKQYSILRI